MAAEEPSEGWNFQCETFCSAAGATFDATENTLWGPAANDFVAPATHTTWACHVGDASGDAVEVRAAWSFDVAAADATIFGASAETVVQTASRSLAAASLASSKLSGQNRLGERFSFEAAEPVAVSVTPAVPEAVATAFTAAADAAGVKLPSSGGSMLWIYILIAVVLIAVVLFFVL